MGPHARGFQTDISCETKPRARFSFSRCSLPLADTVRSQILDNFQELPQLLDPHLSKWIPFLSEAYLEYLQTRRSARRASGRSKWLIPVDRAICKILYTFCKVRGEKVVVHFLNVEAKYLELLLSAVEETETIPPDQESRLEWSWEQRYVVLLWLSHLMLAPFDLSTISSVDLAEDAAPEIPGLQWPQDLPGIALRVIPLGIKYLASPGKERDAAKLLLVRIAMRRDMQQLGVLESLMRWAVASLRPHKDAVPAASYFYLGALSFLAGILRSSSDTSDMNKYLVTIFNAVHALTAGENETAKMIVSLALARKVITKVLRSVVVLLLRQTPQDMESTELTETAIGYFLECLSDNDTPVRLAASKSLSIITLRLDPEMASQVVEAVLGSLNRNVLWSRTSTAVGERPVRDLSAVDNLEWHGLMLTLSHLLFRRSPPAEQLSDIIHALLLGLSFEQRSTTGGSVGANVRDAACFGVWALARRYSTEELVAVPTDSVFAAKAHPAASSILQVLGTELVVAGCLDPAGNIRRGASAALQELIGRHPDTVERGIGVVQTVDYHAVARRSRAIEEVAVNATKLSTQYGDALIDGILGWRGVGDVTDASRRCSGATFGALTAELATQTGGDSASRFSTSMDLVIDQLSRLEKRQVEERHGLLLCLAAVFERFPELVVGSGHDNQKTAAQILKTVTSILEECNKTTFRRPELIAEAASSLVVSSLPVLQAALLQVEHVSGFVRGNSLLSPSRVDNLLTLTSAVDAAGATHQGVDQLVSALEAVVPSWFSRNEEETIDSVSLAALLLVIFSKYDKRITILESWANLVRQKPTGRSSTHGQGYFYTLAMAQTLAQKTQGQGNSDIVCEALLGRWQVDTEIETRVAILQSLTRSRLLQKEPLVFLSLLACGLSDYTTNARGDIGSLVRVQALKAVRSLWEVIQGKGWMEASVKALFHGVLRLSGEKLDRVRPEAQAALALVMQERYEYQMLDCKVDADTIPVTSNNLCPCLSPQRHILTSFSGSLARTTCYRKCLVWPRLIRRSGWRSSWLAMCCRPIPGTRI